MLIVGILTFGFGTFNIILSGLPNQWFGFISFAFLIWMYFNIDKVYQNDGIHQKRDQKNQGRV